MTARNRQPTALLIPSPWSGNERDPIPWTYWAWYRLYRTVRVVRHLVGVHDWNLMSTRCTWCGKAWNA